MIPAQCNALGLPKSSALTPYFAQVRGGSKCVQDIGIVDPIALYLWDVKTTQSHDYFGTGLAN
jgi:hypothetical protein